MTKPRQPNFMIAGEQKAGTSYLTSNLRGNTKIFMSKVKEPHFFTESKYDPDNVPGYLAEHFSIGPNRPWVGEASTRYFQHELAPQRIKDALGARMRFIICLRQPLEKAVSLYLHNFRYGRLRGDETLCAAMDPATVRYTQHADAATRYIDLFGSDRLQFILFDTLRESPTRFVNIALDFLHLPTIDKPIDRFINKGFDLSWSTNGRLTAPRDIKLAEGRVRPSFAREDLEQFQRSALEDVERLEQIADIDLSAWKLFPEQTLGAPEPSWAQKLYGFARKAPAQMRSLMQRVSSGAHRAALERQSEDHAS
jgi:hypothetical protein